ncbi:phage putative head morphogenesis protein, SPP1 gp7 family, partial [Acetitomaculum ruminis DSM 5522]
WRKRYKEIEQAANNLSVEYITNLEEKYRNCEMAINNKIEAWYGRAAENNNVSIEEARRLLNSDELKELKWSVEQYIKAGKKNAASKNFMKELENASAKFHINRLEALKLEVRAQIELATGGLVDDVDKVVSDVYKNTFYKSLFEIQRGVGIGFDVSKLDTDYIQKIISKPWSVDGTNFSSKLWGNKLLLINTIDKELTAMVLSGMGPKRTIKNIANVLNTSKYAVKRLVLTEQAYFTTLAEKDSYKELGLDAYEVLSTLDNRTCEVCGDMDRQHFYVKDMEISVNAPPFHPFCRCTTIPYFEDDDMQQDTLAKRASRDGDGKTVYELPEDVTYKEWKKGFVEGDEEVKETFMPMNLQFFANHVEDNKSREAVDVTEEFLLNATPNSHEIKDLMEYEYDGQTYCVDNHLVKLDYSKYERRIADVIENTLGGELFMVPRIQTKQNIKTPDYLWEGERVDLKTTNDDTSDNYIFNRCKGAKEQATSLIFDITNSKHTKEELYEQTKDMYRSNRTKFIDKIIFVENYKIIKIFKRK